MKHVHLATPTVAGHDEQDWIYAALFVHRRTGALPRCGINTLADAIDVLNRWKAHEYRIEIGVTPGELVHAQRWVAQVFAVAERFADRPLPMVEVLPGIQGVAWEDTQGAIRVA
jgi:hypothetical protein